MAQNQTECAIGIDVGGTKCAAGVVVLPDGEVAFRRVQPTDADRGGDAVLATVIDLAYSMIEAAKERGMTPLSIGVGVPELVNIAGNVVSHASCDWRGFDVAARITEATGLPARIDADVRAAARAEARFGAGCGLDSFLFVTVGTGISSALVLNGIPYAGSRGLAGTMASSPGMVSDATGTLVASQPLEIFAAGPALASRLRSVRPGFAGSGVEVCTLAAAGETAALAIVESAGQALGAAIAHLVNVLDPAAVVLGGGLGLAGGPYLAACEKALRQFLYSEDHQSGGLLPAQLGVDAGWIGAALAREDNP